ncbi:MAG: histidine phosphatase family protein [Lachnospiraceae bacterium]|nr:histidine phosphatase family protein [Lachnospiraceae bacterium]
MKVLFVRHGKDDDRYRGGWSNLDLIPEGVEQAKKLASYLKANNHDYNITQIISSDLPRTMSTSNLISVELGLPVQKEIRLREINNGDLAGMLNDTALERYPGLFFSSLKMDEAYPNGESPNDFYVRIKTWLEEFIVKYRNANGNILVVTHGGVINIIYHLVKGIEWKNKGHTFKADNCSVHILNMDTMKFEIENRTEFLTL